MHVITWWSTSELGGLLRPSSLLVGSVWMNPGVDSIRARLSPRSSSFYLENGRIDWCGENPQNQSQMYSRWAVGRNTRAFLFTWVTQVFTVCLVFLLCVMFLNNKKNSTTNKNWGFGNDFLGTDHPFANVWRWAKQCRDRVVAEPGWPMCPLSPAVPLQLLLSSSLPSTHVLCKSCFGCIQP